MINETTPLAIVEEKAERKNKYEQDYKDACCEMIWRFGESDLMLPEHRGNQVGECAWQDFWFERAADAGHIDAKGTFARSLLIERVIDKEYREKAFLYYQSLVDDFDTNQLIGDDEGWGPIAKLWLGIMLCEGYHTHRNAIKGVKLIKEAEKLSEDFKNHGYYGYKALKALGELYATGLVRLDEAPLVADLIQAEKYYTAAIMRFKPERDDPNNRGYLNLTKQFLEKVKERIKDSPPEEKIELTEESKRTRRDEAMRIKSPEAQARLNEDKAALRRLREHLERKGY